MNIYIRLDYPTLCREVAAHIAQLIKRKPACVLGLATGSTPIGVYAELVRLHQKAISRHEVPQTGIFDERVSETITITEAALRVNRSDNRGDKSSTRFGCPISPACSS